VAYGREIIDFSFLVGIVVDNEAQSIIGQGREIFKDSKPRKEDIVQE
jgi:LETM1 and EF-hand domain-containing protein 1